MAKIKSTKYLDKDHPIYKEGLKVSSQNKSLKNYIKAREKAENKENLFLEKIADKDTTKDEMIENLKNVLIANGWTIRWIKMKSKNLLEEMTRRLVKKTYFR